MRSTMAVGPRLSRAGVSSGLRRVRPMHPHACLTADVCGAAALGMQRDVLVKRRSGHGRSAR
jgi:hypothetical protein